MVQTGDPTGTDVIVVFEVAKNIYKMNFLFIASLFSY